MENMAITNVSIEEAKAVKVGGRILQAVQAEIARNRVTDINYGDHCDWHDSGTGDCEN